MGGCLHITHTSHYIEEETEAQRRHVTPLTAECDRVGFPPEISFFFLEAGCRGGSLGTGVGGCP